MKRHFYFFRHGQTNENKAGATTFTTGTLTGSRVCRLYELLGGKKIKEYINEKRDNVSETVFEFNLNRFI